MREPSCREKIPPRLHTSLLRHFFHQRLSGGAPLVSSRAVPADTRRLNLLVNVLLILTSAEACRHILPIRASLPAETV